MLYLLKNNFITSFFKLFLVGVLLMLSVNLAAQASISVAVLDGDVQEEGSNSGSFRIFETSGLSPGVDVTINYTITGTANSVDDYSALSGTAIFLAGTTEVIVPLDGIVDDDIVEGDETIIITIDSIDPAIEINDTANSATISVVDNDEGIISMDFMRFVDEVTEGSNGGTFRLFLSKGKGAGVPLNVSFTLTGTASNSNANDDYDLTGIAVNTAETMVVFQDEFIQFRQIGVEAFSDFRIEGNETITMTLTGVDNPLFSIDPSNNVQTVTIIDDSDGVAGVNIDTLTGTTTEAGGTADFVFTLTSEPTANVTIPINGYDTTETTGPSSIIITPTNWNTGVTLTITGIDDTITDGDIDDLINTGNPSSADSFYNALVASDVPQITVTNQDDEVVGVNIDTLTGTTTEAGGTADFVFTLTSEPTANVTIPINGYDATETSGPLSIIITPTNWNTGVTLTITGLDDTISDGDIDDLINTGNPRSDDPLYDALIPSDVPQITVTNQDDEVVGVNIDTLTGTTTEAGGTADFVFTLTSEPTANVTIPINGYDATETSGPSSIIITPTNWNTGVTLTIAGLDDTIIDGDIDNLINTGNPSSDDPLYNALIPSDVPQITVTNQDDDISIVSIDSPAPVAEGDTATTNLNFTVSITQSNPTNAITIDYTVSGGNENGTASTLTFAAGTTILSQVISITTGGDLTIEPDEVIMVTLNSASANAQISTTNNIGASSFIDDDDCSAGTVAPFLNAQVDTIFCDMINQDLDAFVSSATPDNSLLTWSTNIDPLVISDHLNSSIVSIADTYYGFFFDTINTCASPVLEVELALNISPSAGTINDISACSSSADGVTIIDLDDRITGADPGSWSLTSAISGSTIVINAVNIVNFNGQPIGDYIFTYTTSGAVAPCTNQVSSPPLTITVIDCSVPCNGGNTAPELNTDIPTSFCDVMDIDRSLSEYTSSIAPSGSVLTWSTSSDPLNVNAHLSDAQVNNPVAIGGSFFAFFFDEMNSCASPTLQVNLSINTTPTITETTGDEICGPGSVLLTVAGNVSNSTQPPTFNWFDSPTGGNILFTGTDFMPDVSETTSFYVEASANQCATARIEVVAIVSVQPLVGTIVDTTACSIADEGPVTIDLDDTLTGNSEGAWTVSTDPSGVISIDAENIVNFEGLVSGDYIFTFTTTAQAPCVDESINVTIPVTDCFEDADNDGLSDGEEATLGTDPNNPDTDGDGINDGDEVINNTNPLDSCDPNLTSDCSAEPIDLAIEKTVNDDKPSIGDQVTFVITLTNLTSDRVIDVSVDEIINNANGFSYISDITSNGDYNEVLGVWQIAEIGPDEVSTLEIKVEVLASGSYINTVAIIDSLPIDNNEDNNEAQVVLTPILPLEGDCGIVNNVFSPNIDGVNDVFVINCINDFPNNKLEIFDRYGNDVYEAAPYDNTWNGTRGSADLPLGTYFYILNFGNGTEVRKGWIQIIR